MGAEHKSKEEDDGSDNVQSDGRMECSFNEGGGGGWGQGVEKREGELRWQDGGQKRLFRLCTL